jgi:hypothetical protein
MLHLFAFLLIAFVSIYAIKPKNKIQIWLSSVLIPLCAMIIYGVFTAATNSSNISSAYVAGGEMAKCFLPAIIAGAFIYFLLKKKFANENKVRFPIVLAILMGIALIGGIISKTLEYKNKKMIEQLYSNYPNTNTSTYSNYSDNEYENQAQEMDNFESEKGHFKFSYPSFYKQEKINNAPHMLAKLVSEQSYITVALWEYDFDENITIWDDDIYGYYLELDQSYSNSEDNILCKKINLDIQNGTTKTLKSLITMASEYQEQTIYAKQLTYRIIHRGNYLQFSFFTMDLGHNSSFEKESEDIMRGVKLL